MPKNIFTPRDELVCGKIDKSEQIAKSLGSLDLIDLLHDIRFDCERMEQKLISRKEEAEEQAVADEKKRPGKSRSTTKANHLGSGRFYTQRKLRIN